MSEEKLTQAVYNVLDLFQEKTSDLSISEWIGALELLREEAWMRIEAAKCDERNARAAADREE
jgi:hypothetical protein